MNSIKATRDEQWEQQIRDEFRKDPEVIALNEDIAVGGRAKRSCQEISTTGQ